MTRHDLAERLFPAGGCRGIVARDNHRNAGAGANHPGNPVRPEGVGQLQRGQVKGILILQIRFGDGLVLGFPQRAIALEFIELGIPEECRHGCVNS